jgi:hypothetical protein
VLGVAADVDATLGGGGAEEDVEIHAAATSSRAGSETDVGRIRIGPRYLRHDYPSGPCAS